MKLSQSLVLICVALVMFMEAIDTTIINTSVPTMALSFHIDPLDLKLALISYLISMAIFIPISGWIADKYGAANVFLCSILVFTFSSIACGYANSIQSLIFYRTIQGIGSSMTSPVGRLIILKLYPKHQIIHVMGTVVIISALGSVLGPLIGGLITTHFSWSWIFWVNAPVGFFCFLISHKYLPKLSKSYVKKLDKWGFIYFGLGLSTLTFGLASLSESALPDSISMINLCLAGFFLTIYSKHSRHHRNPIVDLKLFQINSFRIAIICNLWFRIVMGGIPFILPLLLQCKLNFSPELAGAFMAPIALGVIIMKPIIQSILMHYGHRKTLIMNTFLTTAILCCLTTIGPGIAGYWIAVLMFCYGFLLSLHYTSLNTLGYAKIEDQDFSKATSILSTIQQLGVSFGVAIAALLLRVTAGHISEALPLEIHNFHQTFVILAVFNLCQLAFLIQLSANDGEEFIQQKKAP